MPRPCWPWRRPGGTPRLRGFSRPSFCPLLKPGTLADARSTVNGRWYNPRCSIFSIRLCMQGSNPMAEPKSAADANVISRDRLAELLNEDLSREYQAIIAYVVYSQVLTGAEYMDIAPQPELTAKQDLDHALIISRQIDYLGKMPAVL